MREKHFRQHRNLDRWPPHATYGVGLFRGAFLLIVFALWSASITSTEAAGRVLYGPEVFMRGTGQPTKFTRQFDVADRSGSFTLEVANGDTATGGQRVTSAEIRLNGTTILGPDDFKNGIASLRKTIPLQPANTLQIELRGQPGTFFAVWVQGEYTNLPPTAEASFDQSVTVGSRVTLDGSGSTDPDGDSLAFAWSFQSRPVTSSAVLDVTDPVRPSFTVDRPGNYRINLIVNDGHGHSASDTVDVDTENSPPVANAGPDQTATLGSTVVLDGTRSSDADGDALSWNWALTVPAGSSARLLNADTATPSFPVDQHGVYSAELRVHDGTVVSAPDTVLISTVNSSPIADAGPAQTVTVGTTVQLDGSGSSDVDGDHLTYQWSLTVPEGSAAALQNPTGAKPSFTVDRPGTYVAQLVVHDGTVPSLPATVAITTENSPPVANAGTDRSATVGNLVTLDGSGSTDADGDPLTYAWSLTERPVNSAAVLNADKTATPSFTPDRKGRYTVQLIVHDGTVYSAADTTVISTENARPTAEAGNAQNAVVGALVTLDGSRSSDPDGDHLDFAWSLLHQPTGSTAVLSGADTATPALLPDIAGDFIAQLIVTDDAPVPLSSEADTVTISAANPVPVNRAPSITSAPVVTGQVGSLYSYAVAAGDPDGDSLSYSLTPPVPDWLSIDGVGTIAGTPNTTGDYAVTVVVSDGRGGSATQSFTVTVSQALIDVPSVAGQTQAAAEAAIAAAGLTVGTITEANSDTVPAGSVISQDPPAGADVQAGTAVNLVVSKGPAGGGGPIPPDPATVAPALDPTVATMMRAATEFLYTGANPIQTGVAEGTIEPRRAAVIRGEVLDRQNNPLPGVTVRIHNHSEFGHTLSRADGMFDLAVNGGGNLIVDYSKEGYLTVQRQVETPWRDYVDAPAVALIPLDAQVSTVDLTASVPMQVARGSVTNDGNFSRQATLLFPQGTQAELVMPDGSHAAINTLHVRATEYTVGATGRLAMPGELPPTSAYTYAVELSVDEAQAAGAKSVTFSKPVSFYVENFLGFPAGEVVPVGYYDRDKGAWIPAPNGRIVKILGVNAGLADLDTDGDGLADDSTKLANLGVTDAERAQLAGLYAVGQSLWRVTLTHFTPIDCNFPWGPPAGAAAPEVDPESEESPDDPQNNPDCQGGSIIECQHRVLGEAIGLTGTPFSLNYRSNRGIGNKAAYTLKIPVYNPNPPPGAPARIGEMLDIFVAGRHFTVGGISGCNPNYNPYPIRNPLTGPVYEFNWDGKDAYGRLIRGKQPVTVRITYFYSIVYYAGEP